MRIAGRAGHRRMEFTAAETDLLGEVLQAVKDEIRGSEATDPVIERLFPAGYDDPGMAAEFRGLTENDLRDERVLRLVDSAEELVRTGGEVPLTGEAADRWIRVLNDARLVLGTRLGVTDDYEHDIDPDDAEAAEKAVYLWLSAVQEAVVGELLP